MGCAEPTLFVISGPSGAGKGTLIARVRALLPRLGLTVSATTRPPRAGEVDGVSYHYLTRDRFAELVDAGEFLEWASVHENRYGTLRSEVGRRSDHGAPVILELDTRGAFQVKERFPGAVLIFIMPPSLEAIRERLVFRGSETAETLALRLADAERELQLVDRYDVVIINDDLDRACARLAATITR